MTGAHVRIPDSQCFCWRVVMICSGWCQKHTTKDDWSIYLQFHINHRAPSKQEWANLQRQRDVRSRSQQEQAIGVSYNLQPISKSFLRLMFAHLWCISCSLSPTKKAKRRALSTLLHLFASCPGWNSTLNESAINRQRTIGKSQLKAIDWRYNQQLPETQREGRVQPSRIDPESAIRGQGALGREIWYRVPWSWWDSRPNRKRPRGIVIEQHNKDRWHFITSMVTTNVLASPIKAFLLVVKGGDDHDNNCISRVCIG